MNEEIIHKSRTARTFDSLRHAIISAQFAPGQKLRIDQLGKDLDASIGAVREALSRLTAEGLVIAEPQKGFVVAPVSRKDLEDLTDARVEIECRCLTESIRHGTLDWEGRLLSLQHRLRVLGDAFRWPTSPEAERWHRLHEEFHEELTACCPNEWWLRLRRQLYLQSERYRRLSKGHERDVATEHDMIAKAAVARDTAAATEAMAQHLRRTTEIILTTLT